MPNLRTNVDKVWTDIRTNRGAKVISAISQQIRRERTGEFDYVYTVSQHEAGQRFLSSLTARLRTEGITIVMGGETRPHNHRINVRNTDVNDVLRLAMEIIGENQILVRKKGAWRRPLTQSLINRMQTPGTSLDLMLPETKSGIGLPSLNPNAFPVPASVIEVVTWNDLTGPDGTALLESDRRNSVAARLRTEAFDRLALERHVFGTEIAPADTPRFPVDVVYTWVDGDDSEWLGHKEAAQAAAGRAQLKSRVLHDERFRNRDELKYSLRSLEEFAPWVRTVHIVTAGQCPDWLDTSHSKIRLVDHRDIYADMDWLPTFNSSGIETQLHRVPGLAEKFLYFNDDFFLGQFCEISDFFYGNGILKYFPSAQMAYEPDIDSYSEEYIKADKNAIELLANDFPTVNRQIMRHVPYASDRNLLQEMEDRYTEAFAACADATFRSPEDIRPIAFMQYHYGFHKKMAIPSNISHRYLALWKESIVEQMSNVAASRRYKTFCINDVGLQPERTDEVNEAVISFLEGYFPTPSEFEL